MADQQQSPINIRKAIYADFGADGLAIHWQGDIHGHIHKDDHGVKVEFASDIRYYIELGGKQILSATVRFSSP